jgi:hypothetical protein
VAREPLLLLDAIKLEPLKGKGLGSFFFNNIFSWSQGRREGKMLRQVQGDKEKGLQVR